MEKTETETCKWCGGLPHEPWDIEACVDEFSKAMVAKLQAKRAAHGNAWKLLPLEVLIEAFKEHAAKAMARGGKQDYVDVANFAMFIWKRLD